MKWIEEMGLALVIGLLLHAVWRQQKLKGDLHIQKIAPPPPPPPSPAIQTHGFTVAPWEP